MVRKNKSWNESIPWNKQYNHWILCKQMQQRHYVINLIIATNIWQKNPKLTLELCHSLKCGHWTHYSNRQTGEKKTHWDCMGMCIFRCLFMWSDLEICFAQNGHCNLGLGRWKFLIWRWQFSGNVNCVRQTLQPNLPSSNCIMRSFCKKMQENSWLSFNKVGFYAQKAGDRQHFTAESHRLTLHKEDHAQSTENISVDFGRG